MEKELVMPLREVLDAAERGGYEAGGTWVSMPQTRSEIQAAEVFLPGSMDQIPENLPARRESACRILLRNQDTLQAAFELDKTRKPGDKPVLVLNFANPRRPGGGIRAIPGTQEEHLCVKTTVYASLISEDAQPFYMTNKACGTQAQTDAILMSPNTWVLRNPDLSLRQDPFQIGMMSVSAPIVSRMKETEKPGLEEILRRRIRGMLRCAVAGGYRHLVLGAWGCGNFRNDPEMVARLFREVLEEPLGDCRIVDYLSGITMAVFDRSEEQRLYGKFRVYFEEK